MTPVAALLAASPAVLAPMEDVTDAPFRRACRELAGARLCVTEFIAAEHLIADSKTARRKMALAVDDAPTAIQIYGADRVLLMRAAEIAAQARPAYIDVNCGCWIPKIAARGAGAGWLRDPAAMVEMAASITRAIDLPVTVKTRIGYGPESDMPIVDLARRLEDAGVAALAIHCRTANMGHTGAADWAWARRAREVVRIPVIVNGDVRTGEDHHRALAETGCAATMIGRGAIDHPWVFREIMDGAAPPTDDDRLAFYRALVTAEVALRGERNGIYVTRRHLRVLGDLAPRIRPALFAATDLAGTLAALG